MSQEARRFRIRHPWLGYFLSIAPTGLDAAKNFEEWTHEKSKSPIFSLADLRKTGLMATLVAGYSGLVLEGAT